MITYVKNIKGFVKNYIEIHFFIDNKKAGYFSGILKNDVLYIDSMIVYDNYRNKGLCEISIIEYLKEYGGKICSENIRSYLANKMWDRIIRRTDVKNKISIGYESYMSRNYNKYLIWL